MNKKRIFFGGLILGIVFVILPLVSADSFSFAREISNNAIDAFLSVFGTLFERLFVVLGDSEGDSDIALARVLLLILIFVLINAVLRQTPIGKQKSTSLIVSIVVSILSVRYMTQNQIVEGILLPYGVLGVAITMLIPFFAFFYFLYFTGFAQSGFSRRVAWIFYLVIFLTFWASRYDKIADEANSIFLIMLFVIIALLIFDRSLKAYLRTQELGKWKAGANTKVIAALQSEYLSILHTDSQQAEQRRQAIEARLQQLGADLP